MTADRQRLSEGGSVDVCTRLSFAKHQDIIAALDDAPNRSRLVRDAIRLWLWAHKHHPEIVEEWEGR